MNEKGNYLTFYGNGISISLDIPINQNFNKLKLFLINYLQKKVRINFSKIHLLNIIYKNLNGS